MEWLGLILVILLIAPIFLPLILSPFEDLADKINRNSKEGKALEEEKRKFRIEKEAFDKEKFDREKIKNELNLQYEKEHKDLLKRYYAKSDELEDKYRKKESSLEARYLFLRDISLKIENTRNVFSKAEKQAHTFLDFSPTNFFEDENTTRNFVNSFDYDFELLSPFDFSCKLRSGENTYYTSLKKCSCEAFKFGHGKPCKHMIFLALAIGLISTDRNELDIALSKLREFSEEIISKEHALTAKNNNLSKREKNIERKKSLINESYEVLKDTAQNHPGFAALLQYQSDKLDEYRIAELNVRHAKKSADIVKDIKKEKKQIQLERDLYFAQLAVYESLFPWLEEFKQVPIEDAVAYVNSSDGEYSSESEYFRNWLSPEEYAKLPYAKKLQLALERYKSRKKTDWEVGIEYERYIGYLCEEEGYTVEYSGALNGLQDMGRDLVITKGNKVVIIQCKRWKQEKEIHEKHIFQLFGTSVVYGIQNPKAKVSAAFVTTANLSETAKQCAEKLDVKLINKTIDEYPLIKCNINRTTGEKIYHLPFDQQYDRIVIEKKNGECYAFTVEEAESLGFRHAFRHFST